MLDSAKIAGIFGIEIAETAEVAVIESPVKAAAASNKLPAKKKPLARKKKAAVLKKKATKKAKKQAV